MWKLLAVLIVLNTLLGGCILQSRTPVFDEADAKLVLGGTNGKARLQNWRDGTWVADKAMPPITVKDHHYVIPAKKGPLSFAFFSLTGPWYAVQALDGENPPAYALAQIKLDGAELWPLTCDGLKSSNVMPEHIEHLKDDCFIKPGAPVRDLFIALSQSPGAPATRVEIVH